MELDPERVPEKPSPRRQPQLSRPEPVQPEPRPPADELLGQSKPEVLASREPEIDAAPPPRRSSSRSRSILVAALLLLLGGGGFLHLSRDVKVMDGVPPTGAVEYISDEIVVDLVDDITDGQIAALNQQFGISLQYNSVHSHAHKLMVAKVDPAQNAAIVAGLRASNLVEAAEPNTIDVAFAPANFVPNDPEYPKQWHLRMLNLEEAWVDTKGEGATVAVIDSGCGQPDKQTWRKLRDFEQTKFVDPHDWVYKDDMPEDGNGHGSHVSGTIAESTDNGILGAGVAPKAAIMCLRTLNEEGRGRDSDSSDAIYYAADHGANVINMSLGSAHPSSTKQTALKYAVSKGVLAVCAAGNDGKEGVDYPGRFPECLAVSAVGPDRTLAFYSSWGNEVGVAGPGGDQRRGDAGGVWQNTVQSPGHSRGGPLIEGFYAFQGTSMATPHVSGVAALISSMGVKDPNEIRTILRKTATDLGAANRFGAGLIDAAKAVKSTGRKPSQSRNKWIVLVAAAAVLVLFVGTENAVVAILFLAAGYYIPILFEKVTRFGAAANLAGHSVVIPVLWLLTPTLSRSSLISAGALTLGLAVHFGLDLESGAAPFQVQSANRIALWFCLNLAIGAYLILSAALRLYPGGKPGRRR